MCNYKIVYSFVLITFLPVHASETEEQETKYCKRWYGKVTLLTREKSILKRRSSRLIFYKKQASKRHETCR